MSVLIQMLSYPFLRRAALVGIIVSMCAALLGTSLVMKRYSMIGDGLSHVGFAALAIAYPLNITPLAVSIPASILAAFFLLRIKDSSKIKGDAATALLCSGSLAVGVTVISVTTGMNTDVCNYMFGSILAMSKTDVWLSVILGLAVIVLYIICYHQIFAVTFDEPFSSATGMNTERYNTVIAILTAVTVVLGMRMMGTLLISSLIVIPAMTAMRVTKNYRDTILFSVILSVICFICGLVLSYLYAVPTGACIVIMNMIAFAIFTVIGNVKARR